MSSEVDSNWYVFTAVGRVGPLTLKEARDLASRGALRPQDLAWCPGMPEWKKVSEVDALRISTEKEITKESAPIIVVDPAAAATAPAPAPAPAAEKPSLSPLDQLAVENIESLELETENLAHQPSDFSSETAAAPTKAPKKKKRFIRLPTISKKAVNSVFSAVVLAGLTYYAYPYVSDWLSPFPKIPELSNEDYKLLKETAKTDLKKQGPKIEMASSPRNDGGTTYYIATNLGDQTSFDLSFQPIADTLVGEPRNVQPLHVSTKKHLALAGVEAVPPGYYWATLTTPQLTSFSIHRRVFLGGVPDLNYETHLSDYTAVRRGIAKAELDRIKDGIAKADALVAAENKAAESLSNLKIPQAKAQAWDLFQETWSRSFAEIDEFLTKPSHYSGKLLREAQGVEVSLKKLHDKHHELVAAVVTRASRQLAPGVVTTARVFADAQAISNEISAQTKDLNKKIEERQKLFSNPLFQITEEP